MKNTRFMEVLFSAVEDKDEELAKQVAKDIEDAKANGSVDTEEVKYENIGDGKVSVTDKENGEVTIVEKASDEDDTYDMYPAEQSEQIEGYLHPEGDGVTPGNQVGAVDEEVESHMDGSAVIAPNLPDGGLNPAAGHEESVEITAQEGPEAVEECEEKEFSVSTDNSVVLRIFSDQEFCERLFSEVIESEETAKVGDLKVEKTGENEVVVTSESTGDQAKVEFNGEDMDVTELESKNFSEAEQFDPLFVVGVDPVNHVIVDAPEYDEASAQELVQSLTEKGVAGVRIFDNPEDAREYAIDLFNGLGVVEDEQLGEPEQAEFSDHTIYLTEFQADNTDFMCRFFSESVDSISATQDAIEDAIENGDEIETDSEVITPIDSKTAVIQDKNKDEFTKVSLEGEEMELEKISEDQAEELTDHIVVSEEEEDEDEEDEDEEEEKEFSDVWCDEAETKFFSENEELTQYMIRLFSEEADSAEIESAIQTGEQVETDKEIITPIDSKTAVIQDKENGEFTKAEMDEEVLDVNPISEAEADNLTNSIAVEDKVENHEEKEFSEDIYCNEAETKFFSEGEEFTEYMVRLFSEEDGHCPVEKAIETGKKVETDKEIITPISATEAIIEDKENGEFTKATMSEDDIECHPLSEEEADKLEEHSIDKEEKKFSGDYEDPILNKFFSDVVGAVPVPAGEVDPNTPVIPLADPNAVAPQKVAVPAGVAPAQGGATSVEAIEDKALQAVQSIQAVAEEAAQQIMEAKQAPAQAQEQDLQEAQFSEKKFSDTNDTLVSWLTGNSFRK